MEANKDPPDEPCGSLPFLASGRFMAERRAEQAKSRLINGPDGPTIRSQRHRLAEAAIMIPKEEMQ
jgi:hypothetical protein